MYFIAGFNEAPRASGAMRYPTCDAHYNNRTMKRCKPLNINEDDEPRTLEDLKADVDEVILEYKHAYLIVYSSSPGSPIQLSQSTWASSTSHSRTRLSIMATFTVKLCAIS